MGNSQTIRRLGLVVVLLVVSASRGLANFVEGQVIVKLTPGTSLEQAKKEINSKRFTVEKALVEDLGLFLVKINTNSTVRDAVNYLRASNAVLYAQPDHKVTFRQVTPNDEKFTGQWSMNSASLAGIRAPLAWDLGVGGKDRNGEDIVVAVVDGGMDTTHKDLADNIWINKGEKAGNGIDDDENGFIDDVNGWIVPGVGSDSRHSTHVAGIIGAKGNNRLGIAGVNWEVKIMNVAASSNQTSIVVEGYGYILKQKKLWLQTKGQKGANVVATNSSFGVDNADCQDDNFKLWNEMYDAMGKVGILSVAATINSNYDVDKNGDVPTGCSSNYLISVTNTDNQDQKYPSSGYGKKYIHLGAPGVGILSTVPGDRYASLTGCSMSSPHVAGAIGLMHSVASREFADLFTQDPGKGATTLKKVMVDTVDVLPTLKDVTASGGRLNLSKASEAISKWR